MTGQVTVAVVYHSGFGHTARQAAAVAVGAASDPRIAVVSHEISVIDSELWAMLDDADAIVFGSPTYMGSTSAAFQAFAEASAPVWTRGGWRDKIAAGFTNSAGVNGDKLNTLISMSLFAAQHGMYWVSLGLPPGWLYSSTGSEHDVNRLGGFLGAMAQSAADLGPDLAPPDADLRTAEHLGRRVARAATAMADARQATVAAST